MMPAISREANMTKQVQYTPGPWESVPTVQTHRVNIFSKDYFIGTLEGGSSKDLQTFKANVRLIAAAPELLEALKKCQGIALAYGAGDIGAEKVADELQEIFCCWDGKQSPCAGSDAIGKARAA